MKGKSLVRKRKKAQHAKTTLFLSSAKKAQLQQIFVAVPTKAEQTAIATALSDMDALIEALENLLEKKRRIKQGAMQELLKPKAGWEEYTFDQVFNKLPVKKHQINSDAYKSSGEFPVIDQGQKKIIGYSDLHSKVFETPKQGIIVFGDHTRIIKYITFNFIVGADGTQLLLVKKKHLTKFLYQYLLRNKIPDTGYNRHFKYLKEMIYFLPNKIEQQKIAQILSDMDSEIEKLEARLSKYKQLKTGMMHELLTGKKRLI